MEAVGQLIGLDADEAGLGFVDRAVELLRADAAQLPGEERLHLGIDRLHKGPRPADEVLVEPGLALVDAHGDAAREAGILQIVPDAQLIQGVAALMEDGVHGGRHVVLVVVGGDADVLIIEFQREGVLGLAQTAVTAVESHHLHQIVGKGFLLCRRVLLMQETVVDLRLFADLPDERHKPVPQRLKKAVQLLHIHAALVLVQQSVIGSLRGVIIPGKAAVVVHQLL